MAAEIFGTHDIKDYKTLTRQLFAEFIGTFLYLSIAIIANCESQFKEQKIIVETALANGLLVASVVHITSHISGGHINPAVTVGIITCGITKMTIWRALMYIIAQTIGAIVGSLVAFGLTVDQMRHNLGVTEPSKYLNAGQVFGFELIMTFTLVAVVLSVCDSRKGKRHLGLGSLAIGLCVTGCQCAALPYTASLNPVRSIGPAVVMNVWTHHGMYWLGPLVGGFVAGIVYRFIFITENTNSEDNQ